MRIRNCMRSCSQTSKVPLQMYTDAQVLEWGRLPEIISLSASSRTGPDSRSMFRLDFCMLQRHILMDIPRHPTYRRLARRRNLSDSSLHGFRLNSSMVGSSQLLVLHIMEFGPNLPRRAG